ncbi:hypothetical protein [Lacticaseibacillus manihotivorans]|uniref:hypothetical protein n=1 Tax=Lacticaseibacillus manihotivorans TaxID=88233 RepID=UPI0006D1633E|nr:hypothetical protein [Lacticaseibacillus manihotivorans]
MIRESKQLLVKIDEKFQRKYNWRYHILIVNNHFMDEYLFFMQSYKHGTKLHYSDDLLEMPRDKAKYGQVLKDLKEHCKLSIEFRDTHHLVHPGTDITFDASHGHAFSTSYHPET